MTTDDKTPTPEPRDLWREAKDLIIEEMARKPLNHEEAKRIEDSE